MSAPTATVAMAALVIAALAGGSASSAEPIKVLNAARDASRVRAASDCAAAPAGANADIECVLSLSPPPPGGEPASPSRIVIRAQWAPSRCVASAAQVVDMTRPPKRAHRLPIVDQPGSGRTCAS